ncbi:MAG: hypothetical protein RLZZ450_6098 [Pseudomonadota bacterium]|jgi:hypothetical protein
MSGIIDSLSAHRTLWTWVSCVSVAMFVGSLLLIPWLVSKAPSDYFVRPAGQQAGSLGLFGKVLRNVLGAVLLVVGLLMLVLPGQGLLMVLLAVSLMDIPGKHKLVLRMVQKPPVWRALAYLRERAHKEPFERPAGTAQDASS